MKKLLLVFLFLVGVIPMYANFEGDGYYRVVNYMTGRWISVVSDYGRIDYANTTADLQAIKLWKNFDDMCCDPASVLHIYPISTKYEMQTQGTSIHKIIGHYADLTQQGSANGEDLYLASGTYQGFTKYLGDNQFWPVDKGTMATNASGDRRKWFIRPLEDEGANFFGVLPTITANGKFYTSMFCDFPFSPYSPGVKVYYVAGVHKDMVLLEELKGTVAPQTPVIIECVTDAPTTNRLHVGGSAASLSDNKLKGVFFCNSNVDLTSNHYKVTKYDPATMRVLGVLSNGDLGFVTRKDLEFIPANSCYISVKSGSPEELRIVDKDEYLADVQGVEADEISTRDVYNLQGVLLYKNATDEQINSLPHGCYIIAGKKILIQ